MNCEQIRNDIALWVGNDLPPQEVEALRRHITLCPRCRAHAQRLKGAMEAVGRALPEPTYDTAGSLWPAIAQRLPQRPRQLREPAWRRWLPSMIATVAAAGVMLAVAVIPQGPTPSAQDVVPRGVGIGGSTAIETLRDQTQPDDKKGKKPPNPFGPAYATPK